MSYRIEKFEVEYDIFKKKHIAVVKIRDTINYHKSIEFMLPEKKTAEMLKLIAPDLTWELENACREMANEIYTQIGIKPINVL
jgi:hypothetical protein